MKILKLKKIANKSLGTTGILAVFLVMFAACTKAPKEIKIEEGDQVFFIFSDTGSDGSSLQRAIAHVADSMSRILSPQFIVHTGDCFHGPGLSSSEDSTTISANFESVYGGSLAEKDWYPILGNHEYCGNPQAVVDYSKKNPRWNMHARYYTEQRTAGGADSMLMVFLDTSPYVQKYRIKEHYKATYGIDETIETQWADSVLSHSRAKWKIVFGHHPIYTADFGHGNTSELIKSIQPLMSENGVQAYFSGHIHNFQHMRRKGMNFFSTSTGGLEARFANPWFGSKYWAAQSGFTICVINPTKLSVYFVTEKGKLLYEGCVYSERK